MSTPANIGYLYAGILLVAGFVFVIVATVLANILAPHNRTKEKLQTYECGVPTLGKTWIQFNVGYYLFALIFLIFDVELIFLYPWAVVVKSVGWIALVEIVIFFFILFMGFLYAHKKGAFKWL